MPDRLDWDDARRKEIVRNRGGTPSWSDMASDQTAVGPLRKPAPEREVRALLARYSGLDPTKRRERYAETLRELDTIYRLARSLARGLPAKKRAALAKRWESEQFTARGDLRRISGLPAEAAREAMRAAVSKEAADAQRREA